MRDRPHPWKGPEACQTDSSCLDKRPSPYEDAAVDRREIYLAVGGNDEEETKESENWTSGRGES